MCGALEQAIGLALTNDRPDFAKILRRHSSFVFSYVGYHRLRRDNQTKLNLKLPDICRGAKISAKSGGAGGNRTRVLKWKNESRYMLSLFFIVVLKTPVDRIFQNHPLFVSSQLQRQSWNQSVFLNLAA